MADAHSDEPDVFHECRRLAGHRDDHVHRLQAFADRYGHDSDEELQQLHSAFFGGTRQGGLAVLLDIHDLCLAPSDGASWSAEEARRFLAAADGHRLGPAFRLAVAAGLRRGELLGLRWSDLDLDAGRSRVAQQLMVEGGRARLKPVPERDRRRVELPSWLVGMLVDYGAGTSMIASTG